MKSRYRQFWRESATALLCLTLLFLLSVPLFASVGQTGPGATSMQFIEAANAPNGVPEGLPADAGWLAAAALPGIFLFGNLKKTIAALNARKEGLLKEVTDLTGKAIADKHDLTPEEGARIGIIRAEVDAINKQDADIQALIEADLRATPIDGALGIKIVQAEEDKKFPTMGAFLQAVALAAMPSGRLPGSGRMDPRLLGPQAAATGLSGGVPSDGGFLVQTDFSTALLQRGMQESQLAGKCMQIPIGAGADGLEAPFIDESSRATGSRWGGVRVYWKAEADTVTASRPKFGKFELRLEELMGLCYATERGLQDATSLESIISTSFGDEMGFMLDDGIVRGTGAGQILGLLNASATVSIAKEGGQAAATLLAENIMKMFAAMPAKHAARANWYINVEVWPQLFGLKLSIGTAGVPIFMPPGQLASAPFGTLFGRPIVPIEQCSALGTVGDILFADLGEFVLIDKGGVQAAQSMHVRFIYNEMTFRFNYRVNGAPKWKAALTPYKGAQSLSPYITLATRA